MYWDMEEEIASTKRFFDSHHITLSDYWLESCIQWYHDENPNSEYSMETLHSKVYAQWLLLDLRDVEVPTLPPNLALQKKIVLSGVFSLQMLHIADISRPSLSQLQKLRNSSILANAAVDQENQNHNITSKRVLHLVLTDGVQEIEAVEYKPISVLNINLTPGLKVRIIGPVTVRRGQILLEEKNISLLGGEVEELLVVNAAENIMARKLNLPENPNPHVIEETYTPVNENIPRAINQQRSANSINQQRSANIVNQQRNDNVKSTLISNYFDQNVSNKVPVQQHFISKPPNVPAVKLAVLDPAIEEELKIMNEVDMLLETERDIMEENKQSKINNSPDMFDDMDVDDTASFYKNICVDHSTPKKAVVTEPSTSSNQEANKSIFEDIDIDAHLDLVDAQIKQTNQNRRTQKGVVAISHLLKNRNSINSGKFTVKAKFKSVIQKLTVTDDAWSLKLLIEDETGDLEVYVHSDIISDLMGYCPSAMMALKKDIIGKDECATATVMKTIEGLKAKIMKLDCLMDLMFTPGDGCPTIVLLK